VGDAGLTGGSGKKSAEPIAQLKGCPRPPATSVGSSLLTLWEPSILSVPLVRLFKDMPLFLI